MHYEEVELTRDCEAIQIPQGSAVTLPKGARAVITQALGGTFTLQVPSLGGLFRISDRDADAIRKEVPAAGAPAASPGDAGTLTEDAVWQELKKVYDPEIPVNIVDLGLIYDLRIEALPSGGNCVEVAMTLTAPGCGMGPAIAMDVQRRLERLPSVKQAAVRLVWDPPWTPHMISPEGRRKLGMD